MFRSFFFKDTQYLDNSVIWKNIFIFGYKTN
jgi:hypothetical protein